MEVGRLKRQGREKEEKGKRKRREREGKGKGKGKERERKGKVKVITLISADSVLFETVSKYRNNRNKPKEVIIFFRKKIPKQNRNCQCFGLFRFEPKEKKSVSQDTLILTIDLTG